MKTTTIIAADREWTVLLTPTSGRGIVATLPVIPHLIAKGTTLPEAKSNARSAIQRHLVRLAGSPAALGSLEIARQRSRIEWELRETTGDEFGSPADEHEWWTGRCEADHEFPPPELE